QARVLVVHHNVLRGDISRRMGLARWRQAQRRIAASGAEVVLCGHDHQEGAELLDGRVVVSTAGTLCRRSRGGRPSCFNFVTIEPYIAGEFPKHLVPQMAELGLFGANLPEEYGCAGLDHVAYGLIMQELERGDSGVRSFASVQGALVMYPVYAFGSEEQKRHW